MSNMKKDQDQKKIVSPHGFRFKDIEKLHPHQMLLYLGLIGISLVFVFLMIAFGLSIHDNPMRNTMRVPKLFIVSTLLIVASSFVLNGCYQLLVADQVKKVLIKLMAVLILGSLFCVSQFFGWQELHASGIQFTGHATGTYLYFLSGIHIAHLLGGMVFLIIHTLHLYFSSKDPVKLLITVTNPYEGLKIRLLSLYWHFMDALWIVLFLFFLFIF